MKMYIANGTSQNIDFQYRLPEVKNYRQQMISIGGQIKISGDLSEKDVEMIIEHHSIYGMVDHRDIAKHRDLFIPYVYSVGEPVSFETITELIAQNREWNTRLGIQIRKEAAVTAHNLIEEGNDRLRNLEFTVEELPSKDRDATFSDAIRVTRDREKGAPQEPPKGSIDFSLAQKRRSMF